MGPTYAGALETVIPGNVTKVEIDIHEWHPRPGIVDGIDNAGREDEPDILDSAFVQFHSDLRDLFMMQHGLLARSGARDLYLAIAPCIRFTERTDDDGIEASALADS